MHGTNWYMGWYKSWPHVHAVGWLGGLGKRAESQHGCRHRVFTRCLLAGTVVRACSRWWHATKTVFCRGVGGCGITEATPRDLHPVFVLCLQGCF